MVNIERFIRELNETWMSGRYRDLYEYYDNAVVLLPPGSSEPIVGIDSMVESYRRFGSIATMHGFVIQEIRLYDWGKMTICHLNFEVDYEIKSGRFQEEGLEVYAINTAGPKPKIVWRTQIVLQSGA